MQSQVALRPQPGRLPPQDLDAEAVVLSAALLGLPELDAVAAELSPEHFYANANQWIWRAIVSIRDAGRAVDVTIVAIWLRERDRLEQVGGTPYLALLIEKIPAVAQLGVYIAVIRDRYQKRELIKICQATEARAYAATVDTAEDLTHDTELQLAALATATLGEHLVPVGRTSDERLRELEHLQATNGLTMGVLTGYAKLDSVIGGLGLGESIIVAGRPGMGKTSFVTNLLTNITRVRGAYASEDACAFFSLEMTKPEVALRILCAEAEVDYSLCRLGKYSADMWDKLIAASRQLQYAPLYVDDQAAITLPEIRSRVRRLKRDIELGRSPVPAKRLAVVAIDYIQLMASEQVSGRNRENEVSELSRGLKQLAKDENVAVVALSQLNRAPETRGGVQKKHRPQLSDLRESGAIEQDADKVLFIYRDSYYDEQARPTDSEVIVGKQRNGATPALPFTFKGPCMRFYERAPESYESMTEEFGEQSDDDFDN